MTPFPDFSQPPVGPNLDPQGRLIDELPCKGCGYNLRGQAFNGQCPECGKAVNESVVQDTLATSDPAWVRGLATGVTYLLIAVAVGLLSVCLNMGVGVAFQASSNTPPPTNAPPGSPFTAMGQSTAQVIATSLVGVVVGTAITILWVIGLTHLTAREPGRELGGETNLRGTLRAMVFTWAALSIGASLIQLAMAIVSATPVGMLVPGVMSVLAGLLGYAIYICLIVHLRRLAARIPNPSLVQQSTIVLWGISIAWGVMAIAAVLMILAGVVLAFSAGGGNTGGGAVAGGGILMMAGGVVVCFGGLGTLVFGIWGIVLLFLYRSAFLEAANASTAGYVSSTDTADPTWTP